MLIRKVIFALQPESLCLASSSSSLQSGLGSIHTVLILSLQVFFDPCGRPGFFQVRGREKPNTRSRPGNQSGTRDFQGNHGCLRRKDWVHPEDQRVSYWLLLRSSLPCQENRVEIKTEGSRQHKGSVLIGGN